MIEIYELSYKELSKYHKFNLSILFLLIYNTVEVVLRFYFLGQKRDRLAHYLIDKNN